MKWLVIAIVFGQAFASEPNEIFDNAAACMEQAAKHRATVQEELRQGIVPKATGTFTPMTFSCVPLDDIALLMRIPRR